MKYYFKKHRIKIFFISNSFSFIEPWHHSCVNVLQFVRKWFVQDEKKCIKHLKIKSIKRKACKNAYSSSYSSSCLTR